MSQILMMGPPGSGKGTQAALIADKLGIPAISTGDIFRYNVKELTELGREAKQYMDNGDFVPDDVTNRMVEDRLAQSDATEGFLLDGYPRTAGQVEALNNILDNQGKTLTAVLVLEVPDDELVQRLLARAETEGRSDDTEEVIKHRLELYHRETADLVDAYLKDGIVARVDGTGMIDDVTERLLQAVYNIRARTGTLPVIRPRKDQ
ncbi:MULTISPECIES: adenylate kinase [Auritidibacter]|uniref:Adenylate kinase n=1 Tax=Auritidibacter ignavus TaxID=678932 RepID=A0AAJ6ALN7_9MICC|nr:MULTISPECIES: adenylate kinase [Auritidibacter]PXA79671.1 adenylate kinase [Auritidibacter sp. NML120779]AXR73023.1 adenylate kinase [Auritidibacter sp. NML130574]NIH71444.1 adenylate kinase [Auritidibacter ignavus]PXA78166.1 adenylate kinase [Auritidibacter sp. NML100628]PXA80929.1 adenylate kinase [Auritidibacter sp. NML120636]